jgi:hypothetical protein
VLPDVYCTSATSSGPGSNGGGRGDLGGGHHAPQAGERGAQPAGGARGLGRRDQQRRVCVVEHARLAPQVLLDLAGAKGRVDRHRHRAAEPDPQERDEEVDRRGEHERDAVAARDADRREPGRRPPSRRLELTVGERRRRARVLEREVHALRPAVRVPRERGRQRRQIGGRRIDRERRRLRARRGLRGARRRRLLERRHSAGRGQQLARRLRRQRLVLAEAGADPALDAREQLEPPQAVEAELVGEPGVRADRGRSLPPTQLGRDLPDQIEKLGLAQAPRRRPRPAVCLFPRRSHVPALRAPGQRYRAGAEGRARPGRWPGRPPDRYGVETDLIFGSTAPPAP